MNIIRWSVLFLGIVSLLSLFCVNEVEAATCKPVKRGNHMVSSKCYKLVKVRVKCKAKTVMAKAKTVKKPVEALKVAVKEEVKKVKKRQLDLAGFGSTTIAETKPRVVMGGLYTLPSFGSVGGGSGGFGGGGSSGGNGGNGYIDQYIKNVTLVNTRISINNYFYSLYSGGCYGGKCGYHEVINNNLVPTTETPIPAAMFLFAPAVLLVTRFKKKRDLVQI